MSTARSQGEAGRQPSAELLDDISPVTQDYLKTIWSATEWDDPPITASELAAKFGTTPAAVTDVVQRLAAQGLVKYQRYKPVRLTEQGERLAIGMVRRHRLLEMFLVNSLGYGWEEVHDEAERLEHAVSDDLIDRISRALGHPSHDPHGDPIPAPDGSTHRPLDAVRLAVASPGHYLVTRISDADNAVLPVLAELGLVPGRRVEVHGSHGEDPQISIDRPHDESARGGSVPPRSGAVTAPAIAGSHVWLVPTDAPAAPRSVAG